MNKELRVIPLGGLGEFGMNMLALESGNDLLIIDAGAMFPGSGDNGIDVIVPDFSYLVANRSKIRGLVLTHAHEDHIGAVRHLLQYLDLAIYGSDFTLRMVKKRLDEYTFENNPRLNALKPRTKVKFGCFTVEAIPITHSTVQCMALVIETPQGRILHTADFKIDQAPIDGNSFQFETFAAIGNSGVLLLLADSTNSNVPGFSASESEVGPVFDDIFTKAPKALFFTCFSSAIHRMQQVFDQAVMHGRKVALVGRSLTTSTAIASDLGLMRIPPGTLVEPEELLTLPRKKRATVIAGSQGELQSSLTRASNGAHNKVDIKEKDIVAFSAKLIPGNEKPIYQMVNNLNRLGADVLIGDSPHNLHVSGHAYQEELRLMLNLVRPKYFVPVHGEYRQLSAHMKLALKVRGRDLEDAFILESGNVLQFDEFGARVMDQKVESGKVRIDAGTGERIFNHEAVDDRRLSSDFGVLVPIVTIDDRKGQVAQIEIMSRGFMVSDEANSLIKDAHDAIRKDVAASSPKDLKDLAVLEKTVQNALARYISRKTQRKSKPLIIPVLLDT